MIVAHMKKRQWRRGSQLLLWSIPCPYFGQTRNLATAKLSKWPFRESKHEPNPLAQSHKVLQSYVHSASKSAPRDQTPRTFFICSRFSPFEKWRIKREQARTSGLYGQDSRCRGARYFQETPGEQVQQAQAQRERASRFAQTHPAKIA